MKQKSRATKKKKTKTYWGSKYSGLVSAEPGKPTKKFRIPNAGVSQVCRAPTSKLPLLCHENFSSIYSVTAQQTFKIPEVMCRQRKLIFQSRVTGHPAPCNSSHCFELSAWYARQGKVQLFASNLGHNSLRTAVCTPTMDKVCGLLFINEFACQVVVDDVCRW